MNMLADKIRHVITNTAKMVIVGGLVDLGFMGWVNMLVYVLGAFHAVAEVSGMPLTWAAGYLLNIRYTFTGQRANWRQFGGFVGINLLVWIPYFATSSLVIDVWGAPVWAGPIAGIAVRSSFNIALQQVLIFGKLSKLQRG